MPRATHVGEKIRRGARAAHHQGEETNLIRDTHRYCCRRIYTQKKNVLRPPVTISLLSRSLLPLAEAKCRSTRRRSGAVGWTSAFVHGGRSLDSVHGRLRLVMLHALCCLVPPTRDAQEGTVSPVPALLRLRSLPFFLSRFVSIDPALSLVNIHSPSTAALHAPVTSIHTSA